MGLPQGFPRPSCSTCGPAASQLEHSACISIIRAHEKRTQVRTHRSSEHEHGVLGIRVAKLVQYGAMPRCPVGEARSVEVAPHACQLSRWRVGRTTVHRDERITAMCQDPSTALHCSRRRRSAHRAADRRWFYSCIEHRRLRKLPNVAHVGAVSYTHLTLPTR